MSTTAHAVHRRREWIALQDHAGSISGTTLRELFASDHDRGTRLTVEHDGMYLDFSKNRITGETLSLLCDLARATDLGAAITAMMTGKRINTTENRPALHTALRAPERAQILVDGHNVVPAVHEVLDRMAAFAERIRSGSWKGFSGKRIRNIVNIGIGGSDLGPAMAYRALADVADPNLTLEFVSNIDGNDLRRALAGKEPAETLFIVSSKTFTTSETITNARTARRWLLSATDSESAVAQHFVAVSTNIEAVGRFGIDPTNTFGFWDWVGGRYSMLSAIGLSVMIAVGHAAFREILSGARAIDEHFASAPFEQNMPVLLGLLGIWNRNFLGSDTHAVFPYDQRLARLPAYLQQLEMESNGKSVARNGELVGVLTAPIVWGEPGTNGQHSYFQLLHQGTTTVPCDFIGTLCPPHEYGEHHDLLIANLFAQAQALAFGVAREELDPDDALASHRVCPGNRPSNILLLKALTPYTIGQLIALYEHTTFTQGWIWGVDSFDQWGVELGKKSANKILGAIISDSFDNTTHDSSTAALITRYRSARKAST